MGAENCPTRRQRNAGTRPKDWYMEEKEDKRDERRRNQRNKMERRS